MSTKMAYQPAPAPVTPSASQTPRPTAPPRRFATSSAASSSLRYGSSPLASSTPYLPFGTLSPLTTLPAPSSSSFSSTSSTGKRRYNLAMPPPPPPLFTSTSSAAAGPSRTPATPSSARVRGAGELFRPSKPSRLRDDSASSSPSTPSSQPPRHVDSGDVKAQSSKKMRLMAPPPPPPFHVSQSTSSSGSFSVKRDRSASPAIRSSPTPTGLPMHMKREQRESTPSSSSSPQSRRGSRASSLQPSASSLQLAPDLLQKFHPDIWKKQEQHEGSSPAAPERVPFLDFDFSTLTPGAATLKEEAAGTGSDAAHHQEDIKKRPPFSRAGSYDVIAKKRRSTGFPSSLTSYSRSRTPSRSDALSSSNTWVRTMSPSPSTVRSTTYGSATAAATIDDEESSRVLDQERRASSYRLLSVWEKIAIKYGTVNPEEDDEVDIMTGEVVKNRGAVEALRPREIGGWHSSDEEDDEEEEGEGEGGSSSEADEIVLVEPEDEDILGIWGEGSGMDIQIEHLPTEETDRQKALQEPSVEVGSSPLPCERDERSSSKAHAGKKRKRAGLGRRFEDDDPDLQMFLRAEQERRKMFGEPEEVSDEDASSEETESEDEQESEVDSQDERETKLSALKQAMLKQQFELDSIHPRFRRTIHAPVSFFADELNDTSAPEKSSDVEDALETPRRKGKEAARRPSLQRSVSSSAPTSSPWRSNVSDMLEEQEASDGSPSSPIVPGVERDSGLVLKAGEALGVTPVKRKGALAGRPAVGAATSEEQAGALENRGRRCVICFEAGLDTAWACPGRFRRRMCRQLDSEDEADEQLIISTPSQEADVPSGQVRKCLSCFEAGSQNAWTCRGRWRPRFCERLPQPSEPATTTLQDVASNNEPDVKQRKCRGCFADGLDSAWTCKGRYRPHLCERLQIMHEAPEQEHQQQQQVAVMESTVERDLRHDIDVKQRRCRSCFEAGLDSAWSCRGRYRPHLCERAQLPPEESFGHAELAVSDPLVQAQDVQPAQVEVEMEVDVKQRKCRACFEASLDSAWTCRGRWRPHLCERLSGNDQGEEDAVAVNAEVEERPASPTPSEAFSESSDVLYLGSRSITVPSRQQEDIKPFDGNVDAVFGGADEDAKTQATQHETPMRFKTQILDAPPIVSDETAADDGFDDW